MGTRGEIFGKQDDIEAFGPEVDRKVCVSTHLATRLHGGPVARPVDIRAVIDTAATWCAFKPANDDPSILEAAARYIREVSLGVSAKKVDVTVQVR